MYFWGDLDWGGRRIMAAMRGSFAGLSGWYLIRWPDDCRELYGNNFGHRRATCVEGAQVTAG